MKYKADEVVNVTIFTFLFLISAYTMKREHDCLPEPVTVH